MSRYFLIGAALALAAGCHGQSGGNPFMRTTVPPPGTGAAATEPYLGGTATPPAVVTPGAAPAAAVAPAVVVPPPDKRFTQPGGLNLPQGSVVPRKAVDPNPDNFRAGTSAIARAARTRSAINDPNQPMIAEATSTQSETSPASLSTGQNRRAIAASFNETVDTQSAAAAPIETLAQATPRSVHREKIGIPDWQDEGTSTDSDTSSGTTSMRIVDSDAESVASAPESGEKQSSSFRSTASRTSALTVAPAIASTNVEIRSASANTPPRRYFDRTRSSTNGNNMATPVSYVSPATANRSAIGSTTGPEGAAAYSHQADYQWLRGKLEYSTASRRWKLRYIPIDGQTDSFGGSVVLPASPQLDQLHPGDFVTVRGSVGAGKADGGGFSPLYQMQSIERQQ